MGAPLGLRLVASDGQRVAHIIHHMSEPYWGLEHIVMCSQVGRHLMENVVIKQCDLTLTDAF